MTTTLKKKLNAARLDSLNEAAQSVLTEEIDKQVMQAAIGAIKKLQNINFAEMPNLSKARDAALTDITRLAAGDDPRTRLQKLAAAFGKENGVIYSALAFGSAIKNFFSLFSQYIDAVTTRNGKAAAPDLRLEDIGGEELHNAIRKFVHVNFKPQGGIFKRFGSDWKKYLGDDMDKIVDDIMFLNVGELKQVINDVQTQTANVNQAAATAEKQAPQAAASNPGKPQPVDLPGENVPVDMPEDAAAKAAWGKVKGQLGNLDPAASGVAKRVIAALAAADMLK